jgi:hypothetical protein
MTSAPIVVRGTLKGDNHTAASGKTISSSFRNEPLTSSAFLLLINSDAGVCCMFRSLIKKKLRHFGE